MTSTHRILVCPPTHFSVDYVINPWMEDQVDNVDQAGALAQWQRLLQWISARAEVAMIDPAVGLPDMPFTANAGLVHGDVFVPSRFRHPQRSGEEAFFIDWFAQAGFEVRHLPEALRFEGAGDALFDRGQPLLWVGNGRRSDAAVAAELGSMLGIETVALNLVDPRFYHLDTCFCPLEGGWLLYFPTAFDTASQAAIAARVPASKRIAVPQADALNFACNAVNLGQSLILHRAGDALKSALGTAGFSVYETPLDEFLKSGGSAKCLTLRLDEPVRVAESIRRIA